MSRLSEEQARDDLATHRPGPQPDAYWAMRWGWSRDDVARLRVGYTYAEARRRRAR